MFDDNVREVAGWSARLAEMPPPADDTGLVDQLRTLEELKCAAEAAQAAAGAALDALRREQQAAAGVPAARRGEGVASEIGLARRESPNKGARLLGLANVLDTELPHTYEQMRSGRLSEWRATILARETACLSLADRQTVDRELCGGGEDAPAVQTSDRELEQSARRLAIKLDNAAVAERARRAERERCVTIRPAPDAMAWFTGLLPMKQAVAVWASLKRAADSAQATGDERSHSQVMSDTLIERVTGRPATEPIPVSLNLVMTDTTLFHRADEPGELPGFGPVPAEWARDAASDAVAAGAACIRRLFTSPETGQLVAMESRSRTAPAGLAHFIELRDGGLCRTPFCGGRIRHTDHVEAHADGGPTSEHNLQGTCERCNHAKQAPGWRAKPTTEPDQRHAVETLTPSGHRYRSRAPDPPG